MNKEQKTHNYQQRLATLEKTRTFLKQKFIGIDETINKICDQLIPWFVYETPRHSPLIINIWGITGTGKTEFVQDVCRELGLKVHSYDSQSFMSHSNKGPSFEFDKMSEFNTAIIIDEIHRIKTKRINDLEPSSNDERYRLWELLSGCLKIHNNTKSVERNFLATTLSDRFVKIEEKVIKNMVMDLKWVNPVTARSFYEQGMKLINTHEQEPEILMEEVVKLISQIPNTEFIDVKNSLIFVLGNLDGAYQSVVEDLETLDADDLSEKMRKITAQECKEALLDLFTAEQVSRLGANHFVMPTLTKKSYEKVISDKIYSVCKEYYDSFGLYLLFDQSVNQMLYEQIVIPSQGLRNVMSGFNCLLDTPVSIMLPKLLNKSEDSPVVVSYKNDNYIFSIDNLIFNKEIDLLRKNNNDSFEYTNLVTAHEAGHAFMYYELNLTSPIKIVTSTNSNRMGGYIKKEEREIQTKKDLMNDVKIAFGGYFAEKILFGEENISTGSYSDLKKAATIVSRMVNEYGFGSKISPMRNGNSFESPFLRTTEKDKDKEIAKLYEELAKETEDLLTRNKKQLQSLIEFLKKKRVTYQDEMDEFMESINGMSEVHSMFGTTRS